MRARVSLVLLSLRQNGDYSYSSAVRATITQSIGTNPYQKKHDNKVVFVALGCLQKWLALSVKFKCGRGRADRH